MVASAVVTLGTPIFQAFLPGTTSPLVGGKLFTLIPGGSITAYQASYADITDAQNLTNPNTNPIILDENGMAPVVLVGPTKLVLQDASGNQLWSFDNYNLTGTNIYDANGNALVLFAPQNNAVNQLTIGNAVSGSPPSISATGPDTNIGLNIDLTGNATLTLNTGSSGTVAMQGGASVAGNMAAASISSMGMITTSLTNSINILPPGMIIFYAVASVPPGWLACNGAAVSRTTYANLFAAIGTVFGSGDGSTTFNVPSGSRCGLMGSGGTGTATIGSTVGSTGGEESHVLITNEMPAHTHTVAAYPTNTANFGTGGSTAAVSIGGGTTSSTGGGAAHNNIQPSIVMAMLIKY